MAANTKSKTTEQNRKTAGTEAAVSPSAADEIKAGAPIVAKEVDPSQLVTVRNGFRGRLVYISPRTGERFEWDGYGDEQDMELRELKTAKASAKKFYEENWFLLDDWVIRYLGVESCYKNALNPEEFDRLFSADPDELRARISEMSEGQRDSVAYRAKELISEKRLDSLRVIGVLEDALGIDLIEK